MTASQMQSPEHTKQEYKGLYILNQKVIRKGQVLDRNVVCDVNTLLA